LDVTPYSLVEIFRSLGGKSEREREPRKEQGRIEQQTGLYLLIGFCCLAYSSVLMMDAVLSSETSGYAALHSKR
jgi:hypothetical protein